MSPSSAARFSKFDPGGPVVLYDSVLAADAASFDIQNIPQTYKHLLLEVALRTDAAVTATTFSVRFNNDSGGKYGAHHVQVNNVTSGAGSNSNGTATSGDMGLCAGNNAPSGRFGGGSIHISDYAATDKDTTWQSLTGALGSASIGTDWFSRALTGVFDDTSAISRITLAPTGFSGNFKAGSRVTLYGLGSAVPAGVQKATAVSGLLAYDGAQAVLRVGSTPYHLIALVYDSTIGKWISDPIDTGLNTDRSATAPLTTTSTTYVDVGSAAAGMQGFLDHPKELYDAGLRLQMRWGVFLQNSGANLTSALLSIREIKDGDTSTVECFTSAELTHTGVTGTMKLSDWTTVTETAAPTDANAILSVRQNGKVAAGTGSFGFTPAWARWVSA